MACFTKLSPGLFCLLLVVSRLREVTCLVTVNIRAARTGSTGCTGVLLTRHHVLSPQECSAPGPSLVNRRTTTRPGQTI